MKITHWTLTEVVVPSRPDSVNSPSLDKPLHQLAHGGKRGFSTQFDAIPKVILEAHTDAGHVGLGEMYRGPTLEQVATAAEQLTDQPLERLNLQDLPIPEGRMYDGLECAVLDAWGRHLGVPLFQLLGGAYRDRVGCSYWTGHRTTEDAARKAKEGKDRGFTCIKFKCDLDDPVVEWCDAIRRACGPGFRVILDPNRRWQSVMETMRRAERLHEVGNVLCLEDPLPRWDFAGYRLLRAKSPIPICMHVSLPYLEMGQMPTDLVQAIREEACDMLNLNGGIYPVKRLADAAALAGLEFWHGSEVDLGILEASYVHKAAACRNCTIPSDIFGRLVREHDLLATPLQFDGGYVRVPQGPGLGVGLDREALRHYATRTLEVS